MMAPTLAPCPQCGTVRAVNPYRAQGVCRACLSGTKRACSVCGESFAVRGIKQHERSHETPRIDRRQCLRCGYERVVYSGSSRRAPADLCRDCRSQVTEPCPDCGVAYSLNGLGAHRLVHGGAA